MAHQVINPYAIMLNEKHGAKAYNPIQSVDGKPVYRRNEYTIWKQEKRFYNTCYKNIIIHQTVGAPVTIVDILCGDGKEPLSHLEQLHVDRMKEAIRFGEEYANEHGIEIVEL